MNENSAEYNNLYMHGCVVKDCTGNVYSSAWYRLCREHEETYHTWNNSDSAFEAWLKELKAGE